MYMIIFSNIDETDHPIPYSPDSSGWKCSLSQIISVSNYPLIIFNN